MLNFLIKRTYNRFDCVWIHLAGYFGLNMAWGATFRWSDFWWWLGIIAVGAFLSGFLEAVNDDFVHTPTSGEGER